MNSKGSKKWIGTTETLFALLSIKQDLCQEEEKQWFDTLTKACTTSVSPATSWYVSIIILLIIIK